MNDSCQYHRSEVSLCNFFLLFFSLSINSWLIDSINYKLDNGIFDCSQFIYNNYSLLTKVRRASHILVKSITKDNLFFDGAPFELFFSHGSTSFDKKHTQNIHTQWKPHVFLVTTFVNIDIDTQIVLIYRPKKKSNKKCFFFFICDGSINNELNKCDNIPYYHLILLIH